ncbi:hypothetical protein BKA66DRAFT_438947 [Pyrenochaeta sp. MPI-SDFR-AT-0127]|nr:hypothetical protein BKA66DRAFT_438947 [Pyrenochaeta sp. MPI-SDFR-AT-0127]
MYANNVTLLNILFTASSNTSREYEERHGGRGRLSNWCSEADNEEDSKSDVYLIKRIQPLFKTIVTVCLLFLVGVPSEATGRRVLRRAGVRPSAVAGATDAILTLFTTLLAIPLLSIFPPPSNSGQLDGSGAIGRSNQKAASPPGPNKSELSKVTLLFWSSNDKPFEAWPVLLFIVDIFSPLSFASIDGRGLSKSLVFRGSLDKGYSIVLGLLQNGLML